MVENNSVFHDLQQLSKARILCVGDVMLDRFVYGSVERISPEAPIPVLLIDREKEMLGGAGNVVANITALGASATLVCVTGMDAAGVMIEKLLMQADIPAAIEMTPQGTTIKNRFIGGGQQMLRVDREKTAAVPKDIEDKLAARIKALVPQATVVILSDYKKGLLTDAVIAAAITAARAHGIPVIVDPKGTDFTRYRGATVITPNRKELEAASGMKAGTDAEVVAAAQKIMLESGIATVLATRSKDGMSIISRDADPIHIPAEVREVFDVSGAGDTVIATFAAAVGAGVALRNAAYLANIAAGIVVGKAGTAIARPEEIADAVAVSGLTEKYAAGRTKLVSLAIAADRADKWRARGSRVGFTNGCFDLLHPGHLSSLRQAKAACDFLIVGLNSDQSVRKLKGPTRPVQDETARAAVLSALEMVDGVVIFDADTPIDLIRAIRPDVLVKGGQYKLEDIVGYDVVMSYGGKIVRADMEEGFSTTNTISRMAG
jgi:D-beta-D-heptose 7-phosphate kinase/D-beta-D-heptose 1-phosphate adenosyltransferase